MQRHWYAGLSQKKKEWFSKLTDGVLTSIVLVLLWVTISLGLQPIFLKYGRAGLLIYVLALLAVAMFSFQQSLTPHHGETTRAWYGIAGGFLAWSVVGAVAYLGVQVLPSMAGVVILIMVILIVMLLWRYGLPIGARFFTSTFLLNWVGLVCMHFLIELAGISAIFQLALRATGYLSIIGVVFVLLWILFQSRRRIQRVGGALVIWFLVSLMIYTFRGTLF